MGEAKVAVSGIGVVAVIAVAALRVCSIVERDERQRHAFDHVQSLAGLMPTTRDWNRVELPGCSVELPGAKPEVTGDYAGGMVQQMYPDQYAISWTTGVTPDDMDRATVSKAMVDAVRESAHVTLAASADRTIQVAGKPAHELDFKAPTGESADLVFAQCGARLVQFTVIGTSGLSADTTVQHMLDTFTCTPNPELEKHHDDLAVKPMKGWHRVELESSLVMEDTSGDRISGVVFVEQQGLGFEAQLETGLKLAGYHLRKGPNHGAKQSYVGTYDNDADGTSMDVTVLAWKCPNRIATITIPKQSAGAMALAETGRCLGPDEDSPVY